MIRSEYYFEQDFEKTKYFLEQFKTIDDVNSSKLQELFAHQEVKKPDGTSSTTPPKYYTSDCFLLMKDTLPCVKKDIETTYGIYLFNFFCVHLVFNDVIEYYNVSLNPGGIDDLQQIIINNIMNKKITTEQFATFQNHFLFLSYKGTLWNPGNNFNFLTPNKKIIAYKKKLIEDNKEELDPVKHASDIEKRYVNLVETPLLAFAKKELMTDPAWPLYARGAKPTFGNNFKNTVLTMGPAYDPVSGKFKIIENSLSEGLDQTKFNVYANVYIHAGYSRAVATQDAGFMTKLIFTAMQTVTLDKKGSDCKTKLTIEKTITAQNKYKNLLRFIIENGKIILLTYDNIDSYIGKTVKMRTPLLCNGTKYCNICAGDYLYELGIKNIGNTATKASSQLLNKSLKAMKCLRGLVE